MVSYTRLQNGDVWIHINPDVFSEVIDFRVDHRGKHAGDHDVISPSTSHVAVRVAAIGPALGGGKNE
jgi:hypothetical protein